MFLIRNGDVVEVKEKSFFKRFFSAHSKIVVIEPGNAIVLERGGQVSRVAGAGIISLKKDEAIKAIFDLRRQFTLQTLDNVITADRILLTIEVGIGFRIAPALDPDGYDIISDNQNLFPVERDTILKATYNNNAAGWKGFAAGSISVQIRDKIMSRTLDEIFELHRGNIGRDMRMIEQIEIEIREIVNTFSPQSGVIITVVDIRKITLPNELVDSLYQDVKAQFELRNKEMEQNLWLRKVRYLVDLFQERGVQIGPDEIAKILKSVEKSPVANMYSDSKTNINTEKPHQKGTNTSKRPSEKMIYEWFITSVLRKAIPFLFDETKKILAERRERRLKLNEADDSLPLPAGTEETDKKALLGKKPPNLNEEILKDVDNYLDLIKTYNDHRRKAEQKIAQLGGVLYVSPPVRAELENAEKEVLKYTEKLKKTMERLYDQPIYINGLE